jgi:tight adherence protein B
MMIATFAAEASLAVMAMATSGVVPAVSTLLACLSGALALPMLLEAYESLTRRALRKQRTMDMDAKGSLGHDVARNGLPLLRRPAGRLMRLAAWRSVSLRAWQLLESLDYLSTPDAVSELMLAACLAAALAVAVLTGQPMVGLAATAGVPIAVKGYADGKLEKRDTLMREQLPDALQCLGFCFLAGCSLQQAIEQTALETQEPLRRELMRASDDLQSGIGIKDALAALEARNKLPEMSFMAVALEIQHQTGGSLKDLLEAAAESVRTTVALKRQLQVQTAQARLSFKVVACMPLILVAVLSLFMEGYLDTFFSSTEGMMILVTAVAMEALGIVMIRRILGVDLG